MWTGSIIAVDWGTTNRRAYRLSRDGTCEAEFEDSKGIMAVERDGFPDAIDEIRTRLGDHPLLMAGMIGSNRGWIEAPYVPCPAGPDAFAANLVMVDGHRAAIVPGLSYLAPDRADVMRGEEVQVFGAIAADLVPSTCLVCHPGTHNKWVTVENGRILAFRTVMTGEMFNLLREKSILSDWLDQPVAIGPAFLDGARRGLAGEALTAELFSVRAGVLLGRRDKDEAASYTSGLLIGADIRTGLAGEDDKDIVVMGRPELTSLYAAVLGELGRTRREIDGERAFLAGILQIKGQIA